MEIIRTDQVEKVYQENSVPVHALHGVTMSV